jgi:glucosamine-6-phosphate deaminase
MAFVAFVTMDLRWAFMEIYRAKHYDDMSRKAANIISAQVILKPDCVLGLATGSSPVGAYRQLIEWYAKGDLDFTKTSTINLDEYVGLSPGDTHSYHHFMRETFLDHVNIPRENTHIPNGVPENAEEECLRYDRIIADSGGIDMQLLGLGDNGHIGFNEPGGSFEKDTHIVALTRKTIESNSRFFTDGSRTPTHAITVGIRTIMHARRILMIVSGKSKAGILNKVFWGAVSPEVPASVLQLHNNIILVADEEALSESPLAS